MRAIQEAEQRPADEAARRASMPAKASTDGVDSDLTQDGPPSFATSDDVAKGQVTGVEPPQVPDDSQVAGQAEPPDTGCASSSGGGGTTTGNEWWKEGLWDQDTWLDGSHYEGEEPRKKSHDDSAAQDDGDAWQFDVEYSPRREAQLVQGIEQHRPSL